MADHIVIKGARVHNLKKQRRYLESLGADARQLLKQVAKPDVDLIDGLSPAIAIQQKTGLANPRSTVGTMTDVYDYLRLLFVRVGELFCVSCGHAITAYSIEQIVDQLLALPMQTRILVLAPLRFTPSEDASKVLHELTRQGFARVIVDGQMHELGGEIAEAVRAASALDLVVDRLVLREGIARRLADSLETASRAGQGIITIEARAENETAAPRRMVFSQKFVCVQCGGVAAELTPSLFSFNSPLGACPTCNGLGISSERSKRAKPSDAATACPDCRGSRLKKESLSVRVAGKNIAELASRSIAELLAFLDGLELAEQRKAVGHKIAAEITSRLACLAQLGLDYLSLDRTSTTLSGGEAQRVRLATQIGASLAGVLYILDEPSIGLHQKDNARLVSLLKQLRDAGNSVLVVEHDPETIVAADYVIDMGPGAGVLGGEAITQGTPAQLQRATVSLTGRYLSGALKISPAPTRRTGSGDSLRITNASQRNLKNLTVEFPIGAMTCVTGVSGAGKSTLVMEVLFDGISQRLQRARGKKADATQITGWENFDRLIAIDQSPIGRTPRSNAATYVGLYDHLRKLFAELPEARVRGYKAERFSFNARGGRCEACDGAGVTRVEMHFLPEMFVTCEVCRGRRYNRETLAVKYKGLSIADVLALTVNQALELLAAVPPIHDRLRTLRDVGLGYLCLGQSALTLSGGEAQRVKLARELARRSSGRSLYILDEPTTGLHFDDVRQLLELLNRLTDLGNTMIIVEHNLDVIKCADHVIDLGPEGGARGGELIASGTPSEVAQVSLSATGAYLKAAMSKGVF
ncbi:MAG: excinuclease subunit [Deltaproteobacteria bacterium]|nr:excinuclease subunit [Deltaproteobacteria bacterium]